MNIIVCIKQVPSTSEVNIDEKTGSLIRSGIDAKMNPYDLFAIETALQIKQSREAKIIALTMGPPQAEEIIREAFMMGADEGYVLSDRRLAGADVLATAYALSQCVLKIGLPDLIICGKQTTDGDTAQVGPEIAEFLDIPHITNVLRIEDLNEQTMTVSADLPGTVEIAAVSLPALISVEKDIYQPRLPSYRLKRSTSQKKVVFYRLDDLPDSDERHYGLAGSPTRVVRVFPPEKDQANEFWEGSPDELAKKLAQSLIDWKFVEEA